MNTSIIAITFDCADAVKLATFWSSVLGRPIDESEAQPDSEFARIGPGSAGPHNPWLAFVQVPESKRSKNRVHLDLNTKSREAEVERLLDLGATHIHDKDERDEQWTTLADPEGNEFCVVQH